MLYRPGLGDIHIYVDAAPSNDTIGGHLFRVDKNNKKFLMGYFSRKLRSNEIDYDTPKQEMLALWWLLKKNRKYFYGHGVFCFTDHKSLSSLHFQNPSGMWARWLQDVIEIDRLEILSVDGKRNVVADAIVRLSKKIAAVRVIDQEDIKTEIIKEYQDHFSC
jgi:hypothetical protein